MFDGSMAQGLVPIFFSAKPQEALHHLNDHPDTTKEIVSAVNSKLLIINIADKEQKGIFATWLIKIRSQLHLHKKDNWLKV